MSPASDGLPGFISRQVLSGAGGCMWKASKGGVMKKRMWKAVPVIVGIFSLAFLLLCGG